MNRRGLLKSFLGAAVLAVLSGCWLDMAPHHAETIRKGYAEARAVCGEDFKFTAADYGHYRYECIVHNHAESE